MVTRKADNGTYWFECPCGFSSSGWDVRADATARRLQHDAEHDTWQPMTELADFTRED